MNKLYKLLIFSSLLFLSGVLVAQTDWYSKSNERIEQVRKGNFAIKLVDNNGNAVSDSITLKMVRHEFAWGTPLPELKDPDYMWVTASITKYFNCGVWGNVFKWPWIEGTKGQLNYAEIDSTLAWAKKVGWTMRGHALLWGGDETWQTPAWVLASTMTKQQVWDACKEHVIRDVTRYKGKIEDYDVYNEPVHEKWLETKVGDSILWNSFKWARQADPNAKLYINDYNIIEEYSDIADYVKVIKKIKDNGGPIDGIGVQGHFGGKIDWADIKAKYDTLAKLGLPIRVTEFDMDVDKNKISEAVQAESYARMMRTSFSHPSVNGFIFWGFFDPGWRVGSGIYAENKMPKIAADSVYNLIHKEWSTNIRNKTNATGELAFRGFYGTYEVVVKTNGVEKRFVVEATKANENSTFTLNTANALPLNPEVKNVMINSDASALEVIFSKKIDASTIKNTDYKVLDMYPNAVVSAQVKADDSTILVLKLTKPLVYRQTAEVFYNAYGSTEDRDGLLLATFGPVFVNNALPGFKAAKLLADKQTIEVELTEDMAATIPASSFKVLFNNTEVTASSVARSSTSNNVIVISLTNALAENGLVQVSYTNNGYKSVDGYVLNTFGPKFVENIVGVSVGSLNAKNSNFYPNPAKDYVNIVNADLKYSSVKIVDAVGKEVYSARLNDEKQRLSMAGLNKGVYCIVFSSNGIQPKSEKLVIE